MVSIPVPGSGSRLTNESLGFATIGNRLILSCAVAAEAGLEIQSLSGSPVAAGLGAVVVGVALIVVTVIYAGY